MDNKPNNNLKKNGFTLIEILVVIFIIALTASIVLLKGINTFTLTAKSSAARLLNVFQLAEFEAIIQGETLAFEYNSSGYRFLLFQENNMGINGEWVPVLNNRYLKYYPLPSRITLDVDQKILIFPSGELSPFVIKILSGNQTQYELTGEENGTLKMVKVQ